MRKQNPSKIEIKIRESNLVKENLRHMDAYTVQLLNSRLRY